MVCYTHTEKHGGQLLMALTGYATANLYTVLSNWQQFGFFDVLLPFVLVFTIVFGVLQKVNIFGTGSQSKNINVIISLALSLFFLQATPLIGLLQVFLPNVSLIILILVFGLLLIGLLGGQTALPKAAFWIAVAAIFISFTQQFGPGFTFFEVLNDLLSLFGPATGSLLLLAIAVVIIVIAVGKSEKPGGSSGSSSGGKGS